MPDDSTNTDAAETFGQRLARLIEKAGFPSQSAFARRVGIDRSRINRMLHDRVRPRPEEIAWFAQALDVSREELLDGIQLTPTDAERLRRAGLLAKRVLDAEAERDAAVARTAQAEKELEALQQQLATEREEHQRELDVLRQRHIQELAVERSLGEERVQRLQAKVQGLQRHINKMTRAGRKAVAEIEHLRSRNVQLHQALDSAQGAAKVAGLTALGLGLVAFTGRD